MGFLPWEIRVSFPGESELRQSHATQPTAHAGYFSVSIIQRTLTWITGSLTCAQVLMSSVCWTSDILNRLVPFKYTNRTYIILVHYTKFELDLTPPPLFFFFFTVNYRACIRKQLKRVIHSSVSPAKVEY